MFHFTYSFIQNLSKWNVAKVRKNTDMFRKSAMSKRTNYKP
jgi:hypothetical protein